MEMHHELRRLAAHERGLEVVEWVAFGTLLLAFVAAVLATLDGNSQLREAITNAVGRLSVTFGDDIVVTGPEVFQTPGSFSLVGGSLIAEDVQSGRRVVLDPRSGSYTRLDLRSNERVDVS